MFQYRRDPVLGPIYRAGNWHTVVGWVFLGLTIVGIIILLLSLLVLNAVGDFAGDFTEEIYAEAGVDFDDPMTILMGTTPFQNVTYLASYALWVVSIIITVMMVVYGGRLRRLAMSGDLTDADAVGRALTLARWGFIVSILYIIVNLLAVASEATATATMSQDLGFGSDAVTAAATAIGVFIAIVIYGAVCVVMGLTLSNTLKAHRALSQVPVQPVSHQPPPTERTI